MTIWPITKFDYKNEYMSLCAMQDKINELVNEINIQSKQIADLKGMVGSILLKEIRNEEMAKKTI